MAHPIRPSGFEHVEPLPGIEYLRVEPSDTSEFGVHVIIKFAAMDKSASYGVREFAEVLKGLNDIAPFVRSMALQYAADGEEPDGVDL